MGFGFGEEDLGWGGVDPAEEHTDVKFLTDCILDTDGAHLTLYDEPSGSEKEALDILRKY